jgi:hypothetical protein
MNGLINWSVEGIDARPVVPYADEIKKDRLTERAANF